MSEKEIQITPEAINKYKSASVDDALLQAVYNSIDADAKQIEVSVTDSTGCFVSLDAGSEIKVVVKDDGIGIAFERVDDFFLPFEKSWKMGVSPEHRRPYHGCNGSGRFKYFAIGEKLDWETTYKKDDILYTYAISLDGKNPTKLQCGEPKRVDSGTTGTTLSISKLRAKATRFFTERKVGDELIGGLVLDLRLSSNLLVKVQGRVLNTDELVETSQHFTTSVEDDNKNSHSVDCDIIAWKRDVQFVDHKHMFFYNADSQYIDKIASGIPADTRMPLHTLIVKSTIFGSRSSIETRLSSIYHKIERAVYPECLIFLARVRNANLSTQLSKIIEDPAYPFKDPVTNAIEDAERTAYNACVYTLLADSNGVVSEKKQQIIKVVLPLLKRAFSGDYVLSENIDQVLELSPDDSKSFNRMVTRIKLSKLISKYDKLRHRVDFLDILEKLVHSEPIATRLAERTQLHRIVAEEAWVFGKEYDNDDLVTSDKSIITLIRQLNARRDYVFEDSAENGGLEQIEKYISENKSDLDSCLKKIPDLVLCKQVQDGDRTNIIHLIIELKRPTVVIDRDCLNQALAVYDAISHAADNRGGLEISVKHKWRYCLVSTGIKDSLKGEYTAGKHLAEKMEGHYVIDYLGWREIIDKARDRLEKELKEVNIQASDDDCQILLNTYKSRFNVQLSAE